MKTIYISGPMTGLPALNRPAFDAESSRLRALGYTVVNPAEVELHAGATWHDYMRADIPLLCKCDAIVMLDGWTASRGAVIEHRIAIELGMSAWPVRAIVAPRCPAPVNFIFESPPCAHFAGAQKAAA